MNRLLAIVITVLGFSWMLSAAQIDYPTYNGPSRSIDQNAWSPSDAAMYEYEEERQSSFNSTSPYTRQIDPNLYRSVNSMAQEASNIREYSLPVSAVTVTGGVTTFDANGESETPGVRRISGRPGYDPAVPDNPYPIGDAPWLFMLLIAAGYVVYAYRRHRQA